MAGGGGGDFRNKEKQLMTARSEKSEFPNFLSVVAIMKNEAKYLQEWLEYYRIIGVDKFYLYDNGSTDETAKILKPYIESGIVELTYLLGEKMQIPAYTDFITRFKNDTKWAIIVDLDEFVVSKKCGITDFLRKLPNKVSQIIVPWIFFGSNGHKTQPDGLVIENYTKRATKPRLYKSIINPRRVLVMKCHEHTVVGKTIFQKMDTLLVNHYYCKSLQEYLRRANRGDALNGNDFAQKEFVKSTFDKFDTNDVPDLFIQQYVPAIKDRMKKFIPPQG